MEMSSLTSCPGRYCSPPPFTGKDFRYRLNRRLGGTRSLCGWSQRTENILLLPGFKHRIIGPVASRYIDYVIFGLIKMAIWRMRNSVFGILVGQMKRSNFKCNLPSKKRNSDQLNSGDERLPWRAVTYSRVSFAECRQMTFSAQRNKCVTITRSKRY